MKLNWIVHDSPTMKVVMEPRSAVAATCFLKHLKAFGPDEAANEIDVTSRTLEIVNL